MVTPAGGSGDADLTITPQGNTSPSERTGRVTVNGKTVLVAQAGAPPPPPVLDLCASMYLQREGDQISKWGLMGVTWFTVYADKECTWVTQATVEWISVETGGGGTGVGAVAYMAKPNYGTDVRSGVIAVGIKSFTVKQPGGVVGSNGTSDGGGDSSDSNGGTSGGESG
ncbi:MAG: BACON domain-containing protein [Betaproteobacteria bacterium]|nr:BACON domain-containing protein [Betaproteobacteria bacterium]